MESILALLSLLLLIVIITFPANLPIFVSFMYGLLSKKSFRNKVIHNSLLIGIIIVVCLLWEYFIIGRSGFPDSSNTPVQHLSKKEYRYYIAELFNLYMWVTISSIISFHIGHGLHFVIINVKQSLFKKKT